MSDGPLLSLPTARWEFSLTLEADLQPAFEQAAYPHRTNPPGLGRRKPEFFQGIVSAEVLCAAFLSGHAGMAMNADDLLKVPRHLFQKHGQGVTASCYEPTMTVRTLVSHYVGQCQMPLHVQGCRLLAGKIRTIDNRLACFSTPL